MATTNASDASLLGIQSQLAEIPYSVPKPTLPIRDKSKEDTILATASANAQKSNDAYQKMIDAKLSEIASTQQAKLAADQDVNAKYKRWDDCNMFCGDLYNNVTKARSNRDVLNNLLTTKNAELAALKKEQTDKANAIIAQGKVDADTVYKFYLSELDNYNKVLLPAWEKSYSAYQASEKARIAKVQLEMSAEQAKQTAAAEKAKTDAINAKLAQAILAKQAGISDESIEKQSGTYVPEDNTNTLAKYGLWAFIIVVLGVVISKFSN